MNLKDYIDNHKEEFDDQTFDQEMVWDKIDMELDRKSAFSRRFLKIAAAVLIIIMAGTSLYVNGYRNGQNNILNASNPEWVEIESFYGEQYTSLISDLVKTDEYDDATKSAFLRTLEALDLEQVRLKNRLKLEPNNDEILTALVNNFKQQIAALELFLNPSAKDDHLKINENEYISM